MDSVFSRDDGIVVKYPHVVENNFSIVLVSHGGQFDSFGNVKGGYGSLITLAGSSSLG